jgi:hypothetical protein
LLKDRIDELSKFLLKIEKKLTKLQFGGKKYNYELTQEDQIPQIKKSIITLEKQIDMLKIII